MIIRYDAELPPISPVADESNLHGSNATNGQYGSGDLAAPGTLTPPGQEPKHAEKSDDFSIFLFQTGSGGSELPSFEEYSVVLSALSALRPCDDDGHSSKLVELRNYLIVNERESRRGNEFASKPIEVKLGSAVLRELAYLLNDFAIMGGPVEDSAVTQGTSLPTPQRYIVEAHEMAKQILTELDKRGFTHNEAVITDMGQDYYPSLEDARKIDIATGYEPESAATRPEDQGVVTEINPRGNTKGRLRRVVESFRDYITGNDVLG